MNNSENKGLDPQTLDKMIKLASKKLGMTPETLKSAVSDPKKAENLLSSLGKNPDKTTRTGVDPGTLKSPAALEKLINNNPKAKKLLMELMGENGAKK